MLFKLLERFWIVNPTIGLFVGGGGGRTAAYQITNSVRLDSARSSRLSRTFASAGGNTWTLSCWIKKCATSGAASQVLLGEGATATNNAIWHQWSAADTVGVSNSVGTALCTSTAKFRDPTGWYHFCVKNTAGTVTFYVNNVAVATAAGTVNINTNAAHYIGCGAGTSYFADIYLADLYFIDGQALSPSSFAMEDTNGVWIPKAWSGTYGSNGCHLDFKNATSTTTLGYDVSGNANHWTPGGSISVTAGINYDSMTDTPTNNYATLNPLRRYSTNSPANGLLNSGGTGAVLGGVCSWAITQKTYWEVKLQTGVGGSYPIVGLVDGDCSAAQVVGRDPTYKSWGYQCGNGIIYKNAVAGATFTTCADNDLMMLAYDPATRRIWVGRNGTWFNSGDPDAGTGYLDTLTAGEYFPADSHNSTPNVSNFGQRPLSYKSGATYKNSTFSTLCTSNMSPVAITNPKLHFDTNTRTGTAATYNVTGKLFKPDFAWIKARSNVQDHILYDSVRGATKRIYSSTTAVEDTDPNGLQSFNSDGFTHGTGAGNTSTYTYIDWLWKAGGTPVANNVGTISANQTAGFSVCAWSHTSGVADTVNHGLGEVPDMLIWKERNAGANNWFVQHKGLSGGVVGGRCLYLNSNVPDAANYVFSAATSTSVTFLAGSGTATMVMYAFKEIAGYSKFGTYVGNSADDGPFVYCGFRPKYVLIKDKTATAHWFILDATRNTYNQVDLQVEPNLSNAEAVGATIDCLANGFKPRTTGGGINVTGSTYVFAAFAEHPFGGSNVAPSPAR